MRKGTTHTIETKRKISNALRGEKHPNWGRKFSLDYCQKLSDAHKGKKFSLETRRKMGESRRGNQNRRGKEHSLEARQKISEAMQGRFQGEKHWNWKGGRGRTNSYVVVLKSGYPHCYIYEHRLIMEEHLGRILKPDEVIHHVNGIRDDNRIENLMLFPSQIEHMAHHKKNRGP